MSAQTAGPTLSPSPAPSYRRELVPLTALVAEARSMELVLAEDVRSQTPHEPVLLRVRDDMDEVEIADGLHRVADVIRAGGTHVLADIDDVADEEPLQPPFYDFSTHIATTVVLGPGKMPYTGVDPATRRLVPTEWPIFPAGGGARIGVIWRSPVTGRYSTYLIEGGATLRDHANMAEALQERGLRQKV